MTAIQKSRFPKKGNGFFSLLPERFFIVPLSPW